jgi:hypothetical protein
MLSIFHVTVSECVPARCTDVFGASVKISADVEHPVAFAAQVATVP